MANAGLWYDKFCNQWSDNFEGLWKPETAAGSAREGRLSWVAGLAKNLGGRTTVGEGKLIEEYSCRLGALAKGASGILAELETVSRIVPGLGNSNPVETSLRWHPALGVPFIPGSSLKGVTRAFASHERVSTSTIERIFGPEDTRQARAGSVIFLDALPTRPVVLEADVMTPHYAGYYAGVELWPADWEDPVPIPFLTVEKGTQYRLAVIPRVKDAKTDCDKALQWLVAALATLGIGAKTAVGYGQLTPVSVPSADKLQAFARYKSGDVVSATRVPDPKGRNRIWLQADDGFGGIAPSGLAPIELGDSIKVEVNNVNSPPGYNYRVPRLQSHGRRKTGGGGPHK